MTCRLVTTTLLVMLLSGCASTSAPLPGASVPHTPAAAAAANAIAKVDPVSSTEWTKDMARFAAEDAAVPPPSAPIVFTGSSSIRMWSSLTSDFAGHPVLNRGFGGSQLRDAIWYADQVAVHYRPRQIVLYAGDNDIDAGRSPQQVLGDFRAFVSRVRRDLPDVPITYLSIKPSLARIDQLPRQREANALVAAAVRTLPGVAFVDVATPMLDGDGRPRAELFLADGLHMTPAGYAIWTRIVSPTLR